MGMGMQQGMGGEFGGNDMQTATQAGQSTMVRLSVSLVPFHGRILRRLALPS